MEHDGAPGAEPDYRFTLANERTFLAWVRTALALLAAGVAVWELADEAGAGRRVLAVAAVGVSAATIVLAYRRWDGVNRAMRAGAALPPSRGVPLVAAALLLLAAGAAALVLVG